MPTTYLAFSGGKDSTAMALHLAHLNEKFTLLHTPTGNELPGLATHVHDVAARIDRPLVLPANHTLEFWISEFHALPNWRQRWCTRLIKILPCIAQLEHDPGSTLLVGLRADEPLREGIYGAAAACRFPLRDWGWGLPEVTACIAANRVTIPSRTDCALCPYQRIHEWHALWRDHPAAWTHGENLETTTGHTFRSPGRDTWPAAMREMRTQFENGRTPRRHSLPQSPGEHAVESCRVCRF